MDTDSNETELGGAVRASAPARGAPTVPRPREGGGSGITHLANRQTEGQAGRQIGGEDTVHLALNVWWREDFDGLMQGLAAAQEEAQHRRGLARFSRGGHEFAVRRAGIKTGAGRGRYFRYLMTHLDSGVVLKLTDEPQAYGITPNVIVELGSVFLMLHGGIVDAWAQVRNLLEALGGEVLWDKLSRVDLCADFPGLEIEPFRTLILDERQAVTRAKSCELYTVNFDSTGIAVGSGAIKLRIYDKAREVHHKPSNGAKRQVLEQLRWGGPQSSAVRVEYQLRRELLRGCTIEGVDSYLRMRKELAHYLCHDWFRIADEKPDRENNNTQRAGVHPTWAEVQTAFALWTGGEAPSIRRDQVNITRNPERLVKQARGCLFTAIAELGVAPPSSLQELIAMASDCLTRELERAGEVESLRLFEQKRLERGSRGG